MLPAASLVDLVSADHDLIGASGQSLGEIGRVAAGHADGQLLGHVFGGAHQLGHRPEREAPVIEVETGDEQPVGVGGHPVEVADAEFVVLCAGSGNDELELLCQQLALDALNRHSELSCNSAGTTRKPREKAVSTTV